MELYVSSERKKELYFVWTVRQQQDLTWKQVKCWEEFDGLLNDGYTFPAMLAYFILYGQDELEEICENYGKWVVR